jgi:hypothetical protein
MTGKPWNFVHRARILIVFVAGIVTVAPAAAQEVAAWLGQARSKAAYAAISSEILEIAARLEEGGVPETILIPRLQEAASKKATPERLRASLAEDARQFLQAALVLQTAKADPADPKKLSATLEQLVLLLRGGISADMMNSIVGSAIARAQGDRNTGVSRSIAAMSVVMKARKTYSFNDGEALRFGLALVGSRLSDRDLSSALALLKDSRAAGVAIDLALADVEKQYRGGEEIGGSGDRDGQGSGRGQGMESGGENPQKGSSGQGKQNRGNQ